MAVPSLKLNKTEVVCPICGELYQRMVEVVILASSHLWGYAGRPAIICESCREKITKFSYETTIFYDSPSVM